MGPAVADTGDGEVQASLREVTLGGNELVDDLALSREHPLEQVLGKGDHRRGGGGTQPAGTKLTGQVSPHLKRPQ